MSDSLARARELGFRVMQLNAVVASNASVRRLCDSLGFVYLSAIG